MTALLGVVRFLGKENVPNCQLASDNEHKGTKIYSQ